MSGATIPVMNGAPAGPAHGVAHAITIKRDKLLASAYQRAAGMWEVKRATEQGGSVQSEVELCLEKALRCVDALCLPAAVVLEVSAQAVQKGVLLGGSHEIMSTRMRDELRQGAKVYLYLITCGYDSKKAFEWLEGDYAIYHFQNMIGRELLFCLGRDLHRQVCAGDPRRHYARHAVKTQKCHPSRVDELMFPVPHYWDAAKVHGLLQLFGANTLSVTRTAAGFFAPMHSLLGVMTASLDTAGAGATVITSNQRK